MLEEPAPEPPEPWKRAAMIAGAVVGTSALVALALSLGSWGFRHRSASLHEGRLTRLVERRPSLEQVAAGLAEEGAVPLAAPAGEAELRRFASLHGGSRAAEILDKGRRHPRTRAFRAGGAVYVLYFDSTGVLRDFTCITPHSSD